MIGPGFAAAAAAQSRTVWFIVAMLLLALMTGVFLGIAYVFWWLP